MNGTPFGPIAITYHIYNISGDVSSHDSYI